MWKLRYDKLISKNPHIEASIFSKNSILQAIREYYNKKKTTLVMSKTTKTQDHTSNVCNSDVSDDFNSSQQRKLNSQLFSAPRYENFTEDNLSDELPDSEDLFSVITFNPEAPTNRFVSTEPKPAIETKSGFCSINNFPIN